MRRVVLTRFKREPVKREIPFGGCDFPAVWKGGFPQKDAGQRDSQLDKMGQTSSWPSDKGQKKPRQDRTSILMLSVSFSLR